MLTTLSAEVIGNLCSKSRTRHFWRPKIQKFSGGACPRTPLVKSASGARLSIGQARYIRNPSMQNGWLRPCVYLHKIRALFYKWYYVDPSRHLNLSSFHPDLRNLWIKQSLFYESGFCSFTQTQTICIGVMFGQFISWLPTNRYVPITVHILRSQ